MNLWSMNPTEIRALLRNGQHRKESTGYWAAGYKQANLAIVPSKLANDFEKFALANSGALPLLYVSKVGELTAGDWGKNSDIRTDAPAYQIVSNKTRKLVYDLLDVDCSDMVTFYIGCSYSFSRILIENKLLTPNSKGVSMFRTNIDCYGSGPFQCKMIVSMKAISKTGLSKIHQITSKFSDVHGAPIHYGNPARIGIPDVNDYIGDPTDFLENDVPVFWCCGFTAVEALMQANVERAFTHWPNSVFITDVKQEDISLETTPEEQCQVVEYSKNMYSALSKRTIEKIEAIYDIVKSDLDRQVIMPEPVFVKSALALSHSTKVAIITGCPVNQGQRSSKTDIIPGALRLASSIQSLGKAVDILTDYQTAETVKNITAQCVKAGLLTNSPEVKTLKKAEWFDNESLPRYDLLIIMQQGCTVGKLADPDTNDIATNLQAVINHPEVVTITLGGTGDEDALQTWLQNANFTVENGANNDPNILITKGVSNWGCYGLALSLYLAMSCPVHERYVRRAVGFPVDVAAMMENALPSVEKEQEISTITRQFGLQSGQFPDTSLPVEERSFDEEHQKVISSILKAAGI